MKKRIRLLTGILIICCSCVATGKENTGESAGDGFYSGQTEDTEKAAEVINQDLVVMPYEPLPEEDFAFDPDTGTIMKYKEMRWMSSYRAQLAEYRWKIFLIMHLRAQGIIFIPK